MDYTTKELLKRYAKLAIGQPFAPVLLNILVTSVCDMRCTHCFFTDELDDRPRKKLQMKTHEIERISETLGGNLGVLDSRRRRAVHAQGSARDRPRVLHEQQARIDLPHVERADSEANLSGRDAHPRRVPEPERHGRARHRRPQRRSTRRFGRSPARGTSPSTRRASSRRSRSEYPRLDMQTCTCFMNSNQDTIFEWYDFLKYDLKPDKVNFNYIRPPSADPDGAGHRPLALRTSSRR